MPYSPPDSVVVGRIQRAFPSDELRERARATNLVEREREFNIVALFYTLSFGFAAGSDHSLQAFLERYVEMADCDELSYAALHEWFEPGFVALLREILDDQSRSRGLSTRGRGTYEQDKPPVFMLAGLRSGNRYVLPAKAADESTIRLLLIGQQESLTVYTDGFRAYEPLDGDDAFTREYVVHSDGEYTGGDVHVNTCESHGSLVRSWLSPYRGVSKDKLTPYLRAL